MVLGLQGEDQVRGMAVLRNEESQPELILERVLDVLRAIRMSRTFKMPSIFTRSAESFRHSLAVVGGVDVSAGGDDDLGTVRKELADSLVLLHLRVIAGEEKVPIHVGR
jgi:hypothetical protein